MARITCRINGRTASIDVWDASEPLLYALRRIGLHGAKIGCGLGQCGACTVLLDGQPVRSCVTALSSVGRASVTTIEASGDGSRPDPLEAAFIAEQAAQCGYCTSGMIMSARALLARTAAPTEDQVRRALAGNLCRCGTHTRIIRAVMRASRAPRG